MDKENDKFEDDNKLNKEEEMTEIDSLEIKEFKDALNVLKAEIGYTGRELTQKKIQISSVIDASINRLEHQIDKLTLSYNEYQVLHQKILTEVDKVIMTPDMIQSRINAIIPSIAGEIDKINEKKNESFLKSYEDQAGRLDHLFTENMQKIQNSSKNILDNAESYSNKTRAGLFKTLLFAGIISGLISAITSYYVTHHFPTNVRVIGATSIAVRDSRVDVWGSGINRVISDSTNVLDQISGQSKKKGKK